MHKLATHKFDITDEILGGDPSLIYSIIDSMPESIKEAHVLSEEEQQGLDKLDVALVLHIPGLGTLNKFAHTSPELTQLNSNLLAIKAPTLPDEIVKTAAYFLKRASKRWSVPFPEYLEKYAEERPISNHVNCDEIDSISWAKKNRDFALMAKQAELASLPEELFALPLDKKYPLTDKTHIKTAASYFDNYYKDMELADQLTFSQNLNRAAVNNEMELPGEYRKYAELNLNKFGTRLEKNIELRKEASPKHNNKVLNSYTNLLSRKDEFGPMKTAALMEAIDEGWNAKRYYGKGFDDPLLATLETVKVASVEVDGRIVTQEQLSKLAGKELSEILDQNTIDDLNSKEGLAVFKSLPLPIRAALYEEME